MARIYITTPPETRFWRHVNKDGPTPPLHPELGKCWLWVGSLDPAGYGHFWDGIRLTYAHRFAFGETFKGIEVSHLCEVENCVRRSHLAARTHQENVRYGNGIVAQKAKQTHCKRGHLFDEANTYIQMRGISAMRQCKKCNQLRSHRSIVVIDV